MSHKLFVDHWYKWHEYTRGEEPTALSGADASSLKYIRKRLTVAVTRKKPEATEEDVLNAFKFVLYRIEELKETRDFNFYSTATLPVINSHLDKILALIRKYGNSSESIVEKNRREAREQILRSSF